MDLITHCQNGVWRATFGAREFACAIGRGGVTDDKHEGDGATPVGRWQFRRVLYRPDRRAAPRSRLPVGVISSNDGWCDDPADSFYNKPVKLPYAASHEELWRNDALYDLLIVLAHNDAPPVAGAGSAIFVHVARPDFGPTEGCVALAADNLESVVADCGRDSCLRVLNTAPGAAV